MSEGNPPRRRRLLKPSGDRSLKKTSRHSSPSQTPRRTSIVTRSKPIRILNRCLSEPNLHNRSGRSYDGDNDEDEDRRNQNRKMMRRNELISMSNRELVCGPQSCTDDFVISSPPPLPSGFAGYKKDAKVVINFSVEGSPGPIRTMVKLGSSVEETIKIVIDKYSQEGRTPKLDQDTIFQLHHSHFSLQNLDKSELIGDIGSRSFYLRKSNSSSRFGSCISDSFKSESFRSDIVPAQVDEPAPVFPLQPLMVRKMAKIVRRTQRFWKVLMCNQ